MFQWYTAVGGSLKKHIIHTVKPIFLATIKYQLTGFVEFATLDMINHLFRAYRVIGEIDLNENDVQMMGAYHPIEPLTRLIEQLDKGRLV